MSHTKAKAYKELAQRIERENKLRIMQEKLEVRKKIMVSAFVFTPLLLGLMGCSQADIIVSLLTS